MCLLLLATAALSLPLDDYVNAPDPHYQWNATTVIERPLFTVHNIFLTSQAWLTANDTTQPIWYHWLQICVPKLVKLKTDVAFLYIDGGHTPNIRSPPTNLDILSTSVCTLGTIAAHLSAIPNESFKFLGDRSNKSRSEDALIAYTWSHFMNATNQPNWLLRFPMTKASCKAMDAMTEFVATLKDFDPLKRFVVAGASKRGWTTWTTGAVDKRVVGIIPMVAPVINLIPQINRMWQAYGSWSFALDDYLDMNLMAYLNNPTFQALLDQVIDGLVPRLTMPKMVITDTGDEFFMPEAPGLFWDELPGEKLLRILTNAEHSMAGHQLDFGLSDVSGFYMSIVHGRKRPEVAWTVSEDGTQITAQVLPIDGQYPFTPSSVIMWHAYNSKARDFRFITCPDVKDPQCLHAIFWGPQALVDQGNHTYVARMSPPETGWAGFLIEIEFRDTGGTNELDPMKVTSNVSIVPKTMPFPPCGAACNHTIPR